MKKRHIISLIAMATGLTVFATGAAQADALDNIMKSGTIRVSTDLAIPPSGMMDSSMKPTGSDVETAQLLAKDWGLKLEFIQTVGATRIPNLLTNKADIVISTLSVTPKRAEVIDFSKPYATLSSDIGCLKSLNISDWKDLKGMQVGVTQGTTQDTMLTEKKDKNFTLARYKDDATTITAAVSGQVDCIATSTTIIDQIGKSNPNRPFEPKVNITHFNLAIGVKKGEPQLMKKINTWIDANIANGKLNAIYKKFHGHDLPPDMRGKS